MRGPLNWLRSRPRVGPPSPQTRGLSPYAWFRFRRGVVARHCRALSLRPRQPTPAEPAPQSEAPASPAPASPFTANISLTTKNKFRGQDQGNTDWFSPAIQGGFDWSQNGFYVGNWNSNVSFSERRDRDGLLRRLQGRDLEGLRYDVGILQYYYPQKNKNDQLRHTEIYGALTYSGCHSKYSHTVSNDYFGFGEGFQQASRSPIGRWPQHRPPRPRRKLPLVDRLTLMGTSGIRAMRATCAPSRLGAGANVGLPNYYDYKLGVTYDLGRASVAGAVSAPIRRTTSATSTSRA